MKWGRKHPKGTRPFGNHDIARAAEPEKVETGGRVEQISYFQCPRCDDIFDQDSSAVITDVRGNNFCPHDRAGLNQKIASVTVGG